MNVGNPNEFTISELAHKVMALTGAKSKLISEPLPSDDQRQRKPDIALAQQLLNGWPPKIQLEEGLKKTIAYFKQAVKA